MRHLHLCSTAPQVGLLWGDCWEEGILSMDGDAVGRGGKSGRAKWVLVIWLHTPSCLGTTEPSTLCTELA